MKRIAIGLGCVWAVAAQAGVSSDMARLLDAYVVAKAETQATFTDETAQKTPYTIQVASYINEKDAVSHVEELKLQEKEVVYFPAFVRGQVWFKVCVGRFEKKEDAEAYRRQFTTRMDEPFSIVISLLEQPSKDKEEKRHVAVAAKPKDRQPASVVEKTEAPAADAMKVTLMPKAVAAAPAPKAVKHEAKHDPKHETLVKKTEDSSYSLQVAAFPSEEMVKANLAKFEIKDHKPYYKKALVNGKTWYRLFIGQFPSKHEAEKFQKFFSEQMRGAESFVRRVTASE